MLLTVFFTNRISCEDINRGDEKYGGTPERLSIANRYCINVGLIDSYKSRGFQQLNILAI